MYSDGNRLWTRARSRFALQDKIKGLGAKSWDVCFPFLTALPCSWTAQCARSAWRGWRERDYNLDGVSYVVWADDGGLEGPFSATHADALAGAKASAREAARRLVAR